MSVRPKWWRDLMKYGEHLAGCPLTDFGMADQTPEDRWKNCTCGLNHALYGKKGKP